MPKTLEELENLREFYDPDTVELMEWIKSVFFYLLMNLKTGS